MIDTAPPASTRAPAAAAAAPGRFAGTPFTTRALLVVALAIGVLAVVVRLSMLVRGGGISGDDGYDDGVYYAAADALIHGRLPYRDFLFLQPPGVVLVDAPFAWIGTLLTDNTGVQLSRLAIICVGGANAGLVAAIANRYGRSAAVIAGVGYATFYPAAYSERSALLEPLGTFGVLLALLLAARVSRHPRLMACLAGAAAASAVGAKVWYIITLLVIAAFLRSRIVPFLAGAGVVLLAVFLPFFLAAPALMLKQIVFDQIGRPRFLSQTPALRIATVLGAPDLHGFAAWLDALTVGYILLGLVVVCAGFALRVRGARIYPVLVLVDLGVVLSGPSFFVHYGALVAPPLLLMVGIGLSRALQHVRGTAPRGAVAVVLVGVIVGLSVSNDLIPVGVRIPSVALRGPAARAGCIVTDDPVVLGAMNVLSKDLARGCPLWPDLSGHTYDDAALVVDGKQVTRKKNPKWQALAVAYLTSGDAVILHRDDTELTRFSHIRLHNGRVLVRSGSWILRSTPHD